jgi:hypothetical protein
MGQQQQRRQTPLDSNDDMMTMILWCTTKLARRRKRSIMWPVGPPWIGSTVGVSTRSWRKWSRPRSRWCHNNTKCWTEAHLNAAAALRWIRIAEREVRTVRSQPPNGGLVWILVAILLLLPLVGVLYRRWHPTLHFALRKLVCRKEKSIREDNDDDLELRSLVVPRSETTPP